MEYKIFWCKVNKYYTDKWLSSPYLENKKGIFISTCVVTDRAKKKWLKFVKDSHKKLNNNEKIYISWCWSINKWKIQKNFYDIYPELKEISSRIELLEEDPWNIKQIIKEKIYTKKFLVIQWWCDSYCTFCLTVFKRWKHFSRKKEDILEEVLEFEKENWKEIVITWINIWAWWEKTTNDIWWKNFANLLEYILENSTIPRIRISSLGPEFINDYTLDIFKNKRIYPHFHISVQSASWKILQSMNRHYNEEYIRTLLEKIKSIKREDNVEISIWADLIVWFPDENEEDFEKTLKLIDDWLITKVHVFPFSAHKIWESVPAWNFPKQIDDKTKKQRVQKIELLWEKIRKEFIERNRWKEFEVLVEYVRIDWKTKRWKWWTQNYIEVNEQNFENRNWEIKRNNIIYWILK